MTARALITPFLLLTSALILSSCSTSRLVEADREYVTSDNREGSILNSDLYLAEGASLDVAYLSGARVFLASGATLTGLRKGVRESAIYFEPGATFPKHQRLQFFEVDDAKAAYDDRFRALLPAGQRSTGQVAYRRAHLGIGVGFGGYGFNRFHRSRGRNFGSRRGFRSRSRAVSVSPRSYRRR